ncbi:MAG: hypothetical protein JKY22_10965 [Flavobacteriaceae bacterium]|nr:hypothetical protein [Flavobacteriaceae bacterium]
MPTQGERQNYLWRPNDNSSTTTTRYEQEAEHWTKAFRKAANNNKPIDYRGTFGVIGLVLALLTNLITLIVLLVLQLIKWLKA